MGCIQSKKQIQPLYVQNKTNTLCQSNNNNSEDQINKNKNEPFSLVNVSHNNINIHNTISIKKLTEISIA